MLELSDGDFEAAVINMFQWSNTEFHEIYEILENHSEEIEVIKLNLMKIVD